MVHQLGVYVTVYFVRRKGRVKGPLTREKLLELQQEDRLRMRDEIGPSADGPWQRLTDVYDQVFQEDSTAFETVTAPDEEFWTEENAFEKKLATPSAKKSAKQKPATSGKKARTTAGLFGTGVKPWQVIAAISGAGGVVGLVVFTAMIWTPLNEAPSEPNEIAAMTNAERPGPIQKKRPRPRVAEPQRAAEPEDADVPENVASPQDSGGDLAGPAPRTNRPNTSAQPATPPEPVADPQNAPRTTDDGKPAVGTLAPTAEPVEAINSLLTAYYSAADWQARYRLVKQSEKAEALVRNLYEDVDWLSVQWSVIRMPTSNELATAAATGERVRIDTLTNGHPLSIYVVFADDRWQVDWLESLETLWLTR